MIVKTVFYAVISYDLLYNEQCKTRVLIGVAEFCD